jgi:hypothetical protein
MRIYGTNGPTGYTPVYSCFYNLQSFGRGCAAKREEKVMVGHDKSYWIFFLALLSAFLSCCAGSWAQGSQPPSGSKPDNHFEKAPLPNSSLPSKPGESTVPFQPYSYPENGGFKEPPVILVTPSMQPSPSHFTSTGKDGLSKGIPASGGRGTSPSPFNTKSNPKLAAEVKKYEQKSKKYQEQIDRILLKHGQNWESLSKNPADRKKCEEIMNQWRLDELQLESLFTMKAPPKTVGTPASRNTSRPVQTGAKTRPEKNEELDADDIDN